MGNHPKGAKLFATWVPPLVSKKIMWLHDHFNSKVPVKIPISGTLRFLLEQNIDQYLPEEVRRKLEEENGNPTKEKGKPDAKQAPGKPARPGRVGGQGAAG